MMLKRLCKFMCVFGWNCELYSERFIEELFLRLLLLMFMCNFDNFFEVDINFGFVFVLFVKCV